MSLNNLFDKTKFDKTPYLQQHGYIGFFFYLYLKLDRKKDREGQEDCKRSFICWFISKMLARVNNRQEQRIQCVLPYISG